MTRPWQRGEKANLRRWYGAITVAEIGARLARTTDSVRNMARGLGLRTRRYWPKDQLRQLRRLYGRVPGPELARRLGVSLKRLHNAAKRHGLTAERFAWTAAAERRLKELHGQGWSDTEIAREFGCERHTVSACRERLGLPAWYGTPGSPWHEHRKTQVRERTAAQLKAAGCASLGELRRKAYRDYARANGWPEDLRPRAVMILNALAAKGPMTREQIAAAVGMPWKGSRKSLVSNDPEGSYLGNLQARGLVCYLHRSAPSGRQGGGRIPGLYMLTVKALNLIKEREKANGSSAQAG
jgi:hypothetical protein